MHFYIYSCHHTIITLIVFSCRIRRLTVWYSAFLTKYMYDCGHLRYFLSGCHFVCLLHVLTLSASFFDFVRFTLWFSLFVSLFDFFHSLTLSVSLSDFVCLFHSLTLFARFILCLFHSLSLFSVSFFDFYHRKF